MKKQMIRLQKKTVSFFVQIFGTWKGLIIVGYILLCLFLWHSFADRQIFNAIAHNFTIRLITPILLLHVTAILGAVAILLLLAFALGTCSFEKQEIKRNLPKAMLPRHEAVEHPTLVLFIPHPRKGYIELEFMSRGMTKDRWEEKRKEVQSALRRYTILGEIRDGADGDWHIVAFHARKGAPKTRRDVLYE